LEDDGHGTSDVVPFKWLSKNETRVLWPTFSKKGTSDQRTRKVMTLAKPEKDWPEYPVKLRHRFGK